MTNEEAINTLKVILEEATETEDSICYVTSGDADALKAAIKALEQTELNPSYNSVKTELDCVSREAVQDLIAKLLSDYLHDEDREKIENVNAGIGELPSVQPQRKCGKWIFREDMGHQYCCSECGCPKPFVNDYYYKKIIGCPYCLADMRGDSE